MNKVLAVIPARGGSKRIPGKNIRDFHGRPMLSHIINISEKAGIFDHIHVSTDDDNIAKVAADCGHKPLFLREPSLADDFTPIFEVVRSTAQRFEEQGEKFDHYCLLYATAPLMDPQDLSKAYAAFQNSDKTKALMSVAEYACPVEWAYRLDKNSLSLKPVEPSGFLKRSQDLQPAYFDAAMFVFYGRDFVFEQDPDKLDQHFTGYVVPAYRVSDIDTQDDWDQAEKMFAFFQSES